MSMSEDFAFRLCIPGLRSASLASLSQPAMRERHGGDRPAIVGSCGFGVLVNLGLLLNT